MAICLLITVAKSHLKIFNIECPIGALQFKFAKIVCTDVLKLGVEKLSVVSLIFAGLCILGVVMNVVAFFAHPVLDFIGIREPLEKLTGRKYTEFLIDVLYTWKPAVLYYQSYNTILTSLKIQHKFGNVA